MKKQAWKKKKILPTSALKNAKGSYVAHYFISVASSFLKLKCRKDDGLGKSSTKIKAIRKRRERGVKSFLCIVECETKLIFKKYNITKGRLFREISNVKE